MEGDREKIENVRKKERKRIEDRECEGEREREKEIQIERARENLKKKKEKGVITKKPIIYVCSNIGKHCSGCSLYCARLDYTVNVARDNIRGQLTFSLCKSFGGLGWNVLDLLSNICKQHVSEHFHVLGF